ncbi:hypothetical protein ABPG72_019780 [Tetrahymena utriculariae]
MNNIVLHPYSLNSSVNHNTLREDSPVKVANQIPSLQNLILKEFKGNQQSLPVSNQQSYNQQSYNFACNSPATYGSQLQVGNKRFGSSYEAVNSMSNPFSTPELDDNIRLTNAQNNNQVGSSNQSQMQRDSLSLNLLQNNLSTIKAKSYTGSYISDTSSSIALQGILKKQYEGAREGQDQRMKLFTFNEDLAHMNQIKLDMEQSPVPPDNISLSEKAHISSLLNNNVLPGGQQQQLQNSINLQQQQYQQQQQQFGILTATNRRKESVNQGTFKTATIAYTQYKQRQKRWKEKWMVMSYFISKSVQNFKKILILSKPAYLTKLQLNLINDKSSHYDKVRENKEKRYQGWLYDSQGCCSRRNKKRILQLLKKIRGLKNFVLNTLKILEQKINDFDQKLTPFSPLNTFLQLFEFLVLIFTLFIGICIPFFICFQDEIIDTPAGDTLNIIIKHVAPYVFIFDILKYLNTGCFIRGQIINDRLQIFQNYMRERFICDSISIIALFIFDSNPIFPNNFTLIFFYFRFYFGLHVIDKIRESFLLKDKTHALINILVILFFITFFAHIFACLWYYIGIHESDDLKQTWIQQTQVKNDSLSVKYLNSLYYAFSAISTLNTNISPQTKYEKLFLILITFCTYGIMGLILYESQQILENFSLKKKNYLRQLKQITRYMSDHNVSEHYQSLARKYLQYVTNEGLDSRQVSADKSLQGLSLQLKEDIIKDAFMNQLKSIRVFSRYFSQQFLEKLAMKMGEQILGPDEYVINANKLQSPKIYIVKKGLIEFFVNIGTQRTNIKDSLKSFKIFKENDYFGSYEFFSDSYKPHLSARSIGVSVVQFISLTDFLELLDEFPEEREAYSYIKEMVTIYKQLDIIGITCYSCGERDHQTLNCPYLFYDQQRANILKRIDQETHFQVRQYKRKKLKKYNCLKQCKKIWHDQDKFIIDNADELQSQSSMKSLEVEDNLQLNNIDLPKMDSQYLDSYFHMRGKTSSIGTFGTLRVREDQPPGNINNIYFDSDLDVHSVNSYLKSNATKTVNEHEWNVNNNSLNSLNQLQSNTNSMMLNQPININPLIPKTPSLQSAIEEEDQTNFNTRKMLSKLTSSPSRASMNIPTTKLPDLKYRSKSTHIKPSGGDSFVEEASSLIDIKSLGTAKSPRPNTVVVPAQKSDSQPSLMRRNTTKTRNRVQSFNLDTTQYRDNTTTWREGTHRSQRKQYEQSIFSQLQDNKSNNIEEESSYTDEEDEIQKEITSQKSFSYKELVRSDKQSKPSEKQQGIPYYSENMYTYQYIQNNFSTVHSFRTFFPHNNVENVIEYINKKNRGNKRVKSKKFTKKLSHRSIKKQSSLRSKKLKLDI